MSPTKTKRSERRGTRRRGRDASPQPAQADSDSDTGTSDSKKEAPAPSSGEDSPEEPSYTIDELTAHTRIPSRTIRFYQSSGVLPKPSKRGRIAYYSPAHVERLELIARMQDRGLRMRAIKDLCDQIDRGEVVLSEWLGLEEQLSSSWVDDAPQVLDRAGLEQMLGEQRPGMIAELSRTGLIEAQPEGAFLVPSPGLLRVALALDDAKIGLEAAAAASAILQKHLGKAASELATHFAEHAGIGTGTDNSVAAMTEAFRELRSHGLDAVRLIFAREMEQVLRKMVESGEAARIEKKKRAKRKR